MRHPRIPALLLVVLSLATLPGFVGAGSSPYWKNSIVFPHDPFTHDDYGLPKWIKFTILTAEPTTVYFQDSVTYDFHYEFAVAELDAFRGFTPAEFDGVTLHASGQQAILGAVLFSPGWLPEFGIQLVRLDPYTPEQVVELFDVVRSAIVADPVVADFYFPTYEQLATAVEYEAYLAAHGVIVDSVGRWAKGDTCYAFGWALGRLKHVAVDEIEDAFLSGALEPGDVLLTDAVPAALPPVAGIITLAPATPNSHVVILADTFDVPFVHLAAADDAARAEALAGRLVVLRSDATSQGCRVRLIDAEDELDHETIDEILLLKQAPPLDVVRVQALGAYSANTVGLYPAHIRYFGGKAANYGFIRRSIPASSPVAGAFSFDLWTQFLEQPVAGGGTLRQWIAQKIGSPSWPPASMSALATALADVRELIEDDTFFNPTLRTAVLQMLQSPQYGFDPLSNIRFRSSTNVEDSEQFTGAGLYDSFSGCLADDLDSGGSGPSLCDPTETNERGVFRAIRKVFASFYNLNAYLERLRHGVNEAQVGMAMLVHHSFPDEFELANGVATLERAGGSPRHFRFVTQLGAVSVTNPEPGAIPEIVRGYVSPLVSSFTVEQESSLVQLGATVLDYTEEYEDLATLMLNIAAAYEQAAGILHYVLEFEYKKVAPGGAALPGGGLEVDQVRRLPEPDDTPSITPYLINQPQEWCVFQGEYSNVFANHRLSSRWSISTVNTWLDASSLEQSFFDETSIAYTESCIALEQSGVPATWPEATHSHSNGTTTDTWRLDFLQNPRDWALAIPNVPALVAPSQSPILVLEDFGCLELEVDYETPVPAVEFNQPIMTTTDQVLLCPCYESRADDIPRERVASVGLTTVEVSYFWPRPLVGSVAGYTAPLSHFDETVITGLTGDPLVLSGERSQTYRPEHHNFSENFIFEPGLDPAVSDAQRAALASAGVRVLHVTVGFDEPSITVYDDAAWGSVCLACLGADGDGDGACALAPTFDCDDADPLIWATPDEARDLLFTGDADLVWSAPTAPGATSLKYDVIRSETPGDFTGATTSCIASNVAMASAEDASAPAPGTAFHYLIRAQNDCPQGPGSLGASSDGVERQGIDCPPGRERFRAARRGPPRPP